MGTELAFDAADSAATPATAPTTRAITRHLTTAARVLLGLVFFVFGLNGFLSFIPAPTTPPPEGAMALGGALMQSGYMMPLIKGTEVLAGALLLANRFVPLALALLAPIVVNILAFHLFLAPSGTVLSVVILVLQIYLAWAYRAAYLPMLAARVRPGVPARR